MCELARCPVVTQPTPEKLLSKALSTETQDVPDFPVLSAQ